MEGVGFIETFRLGSVIHISLKYMFITAYDIKCINITKIYAATVYVNATAISLQNSHLQVVFRSDGSGGVLVYAWF